MPKKLLRWRGSFDLRNRPPIVLTPKSTDADFATAVALKKGVLRGCGIELDIETHARVEDLGPRIEIHRRGRRGQSYRLEIRPRSIGLQAEGRAGLRYGVETLLQLVGPKGEVPACRIEDSPDLALRGVLIDISRGKVPTLDTLRALVDMCVRLKLNTLMLYTEHTFRFRRHPEIGAGASPLTAETIRQLDSYAAANHVELIPTLQSLGHMHHILKLPRYRHLAESDRLWSLAPGKPRTYQLLRDLYDEYLPNFRSRLFNANCDEPVDLADHNAFFQHVERVRELALAHGKRTMIWGDVIHAHPESIAKLDRDLVLLDWWYEADHDFDRVRRFSEHGIEFVVCPGTSSWNALFPRMANSIANISRYAAAGKRYGAWGLVNTDWGDGGHYNLLGNSWFGFAWGAQQSWSGDVSPELFDRAFSRLFFGDSSGKIARAYRALGAAHGTGFKVANASPIQSLYFDDLGPAKFIARAKAKKLESTENRLRRVRAVLKNLEGRFLREKTTHQELLYATDASLLAVRKAVAGLAYWEWRLRPASLNATERRRLSRRLASLASEQTALGRNLWRLWRERNLPSNFEITKKKFETSIRSLRRAARSLDNNRPPPPRQV
jgi:hexosaminidase